MSDAEQSSTPGGLWAWFRRGLTILLWGLVAWLGWSWLQNLEALPDPVHNVITGLFVALAILGSVVWEMGQTIKNIRRQVSTLQGQVHTLRQAVDGGQFQKQINLLHTDIDGIRQRLADGPERFD